MMGAFKEKVKELWNKIVKWPMWKSKKFLRIAGGSVLAIVLLIILIVVIPDEKTLDEQLEQCRVYLSSNEYNEAAILLEKILEENPKCTEAYEYLARAYDELGNMKDAREILAEGVALTNSEKLQGMLAERENKIADDGGEETTTNIDEEPSLEEEISSEEVSSSEEKTTKKEQTTTKKQADTKQTTGATTKSTTVKAETTTSSANNNTETITVASENQSTTKEEETTSKADEESTDETPSESESVTEPTSQSDASSEDGGQDESSSSSESETTSTADITE